MRLQYFIITMLCLLIAACGQGLDVESLSNNRGPSLIDPVFAVPTPMAKPTPTPSFPSHCDGSGGPNFALGTYTAPPTAEITTTSNLSDPTYSEIAPYTALFIGKNSTAQIGREIVRWDWDFGDANSSDPRYGEGMLAAHRYDAPGTYVVRLLVTDSAGEKSLAIRNVVISPFSGTTFYLSSSAGNDTNNGLTPATAWATLDYALAHLGGSRGNPNRLLLRRGDVWSSTHSLLPPRPSIIGAFGTGARPLIQMAENTDLEWSGGGGIGGADLGVGITLEDLAIHFPHPNQGENSVTPFLKNSVLRRLEIINGTITATLQLEGLVVEESTVQFARRQGIFSSGDSVVFRRNTMSGSGTNEVLDHQLYFSSGSQWLIENSVFDGYFLENNFATKIDSGQTVVIRGCVATRTRNGFGIGANSGQNLSHDIVLEDSLSFDNGRSNQSAAVFLSGADRMLIRNNIFWKNNPAPDYGQATIDFFGDNHQILGYYRIYNNTFFDNGIHATQPTNPNFGMPDIMLDTTYVDLDIKNNIFYRSLGNAGFLASNDPNPSAILARVHSDYNLFLHRQRLSSALNFASFAGAPSFSFTTWQAAGHDTHSVYLDPLFVDSPHLDFHVESSSPAINRGTSLPQIFKDYDCNPRQVGGASDMGAFEFVP